MIILEATLSFLGLGAEPGWSIRTCATRSGETSSEKPSGPADRRRAPPGRLGPGGPRRRLRGRGRPGAIPDASSRDRGDGRRDLLLRDAPQGRPGRGLLGPAPDRDLRPVALASCGLPALLVCAPQPGQNDRLAGRFRAAFTRNPLLIPHDAPPALRTGGGRRVGVLGVFHGRGRALAGLVALRFLLCRNVRLALRAFHLMDLREISSLY